MKNEKQVEQEKVKTRKAREHTIKFRLSDNEYKALCDNAEAVMRLCGEIQKQYAKAGLKLGGNN